MQGTNTYTYNRSIWRVSSWAYCKLVRKGPHQKLCLIREVLLEKP